MHKGAQSALLGSATAAAAAAASASTNAAASRGSRYTGPVYNVYSQEIDPNNMMPAPNQAPAPGQSVPLPVERVKSTIPKGGVDGNWLYPSPQMFYNSLVRKQKADNVDARDMNIVVSIHNEMNERTWALLREWEALHTRCAVYPRAVQSVGANHRSRFHSPLPFGTRDAVRSFPLPSLPVAANIPRASLHSVVFKGTRTSCRRKRDSRLG